MTSRVHDDIYEESESLFSFLLSSSLLQLLSGIYGGLSVFGVVHCIYDNQTHTDQQMDPTCGMEDVYGLTHKLGEK